MKNTQTDRESRENIYGLPSDDRSNDCVLLMLGPTHVGNSISWILAAVEHACAKFDLNICNDVQCWLCCFIFLLPLSFCPLPGFSRFISKKSTGNLHGGHHILPRFLMQFGRKKEQFKSQVTPSMTYTWEHQFPMYHGDDDNTHALTSECCLGKSVENTVKWFVKVTVVFSLSILLVQLLMYINDLNLIYST